MSNDATTAVPTIHEATLAGGPSGVVHYGPEIDFDAAVVRRAAGEDVVVRGEDHLANKRLAYQIELGVGPPTRPQAPHKNAGLAALPHYHQASRQPPGHTFYETDNRKARKRP